MKNSNIILSILMVVVLFLAGCKANWVETDPSVGFYKVPAVTTKINTGSSATIPLATADAFKAEVVIGLYFNEGPTPQKVDLIARKNEKNGAAVKVVQAGITTFPSTIAVTGAQLKSLFGEDFKAGDLVDLAVDVYTADGKFEAYPSNGRGTATSVSGMPAYSAQARFTVR